MKAISLFSGQGGLDVGFEDAGYEIMSAIEFNAYACETLRENRRIANMKMSEFNIWFELLMRQRCFASWSHKSKSLLKNRLCRGVGKSTHFKNTRVIEDDIRKVDAAGLMQDLRLRSGELDLIIGGPPCQTFSRSGKRQSVKDERGQLFLEFARFVNTFRPRWFVLENVKGMTLTKTDVSEGKCRSCEQPFLPTFEEYLDWKETGASCVCPACGGDDTKVWERPLIRGGAVEIIINEFERLGYRCQKNVLNALDYGAPQNRERLIIVGSRDGEPYSFPAAQFTRGNAQASLFDEQKSFRSTWDCLFGEPNPYHSPEVDIDRSVLWVKNVVRPHAEPVTWSLRRPCPTVGAHQSAKLAIAPFGVPEEQLARQQWHTLGRRQGDTSPVPVEHTYLSDEDLLKLQTFPAYWFVAGTRMERAFQIGNAVPPVLARAIAQNLGKSKRDTLVAAE
jgi:DNA (cytosine-5)-methyltransferase 1